MKGNLKNTLKNVYKNTNNNVSVNTNVKNITNRLKNNNLYDNFIDYKNVKVSKSSTNSAGPSNVISNKNNLFFYVSLALLFILTLILFIYMFSEDISDYLNNLFKNEKLEDMEKDIIKKNDVINNSKDKISSLEKNVKNNEIKIKKLTDELKNKEKPPPSKKASDINPKKKKDINAIYSKSNVIQEDSFCYVGQDNYERYCVKAYPGEICQSGDIYNRLDKCVLPKLRV
tara:strand:+ start:212 stop:898 length:687 start_codon:yes stop_codon:yes gene_type:complete